MRTLALVGMMAAFVLVSCGGGGGSTANVAPTTPSAGTPAPPPAPVVDRMPATPETETPAPPPTPVVDRTPATPETETPAPPPPPVVDRMPATPETETPAPPPPPVVDRTPAPPPARMVERLPFPFREWRCQLAHIAGACGIDGVIDRPHFGIWGLPDQVAADAKRSPISHDHDGNNRRIFVGVDQGIEYVGNLAVSQNRGDVEIRFGALNDGAGYDQVSRYLSQTAPNAVIPSNNKVRIIGASNRREQNRVLAAVRLVNSALPEASKLSFDPSLPDFSLQHTVIGNTRYRDGTELADTIHIEFVPRRSSAGGTGAATTWAFYDHAYVQFYTRSSSYFDDRQSVILLAHEIMHALGLNGHVSSSFPSIMKGTAEIHAVSQGGLIQPMSLLYPVDREALRALYSRLQDASDSTAFGPWSRSSLHIHGNSPHAGFGVAMRNGYAEPWAYGYFTGYGLETNDALSGTVTWNGELVGFTPDVEAVMGDAAIRVDVSSLQGTATFTGLEHWGVRQAPGAQGTGTIWGDGDLRYTIAVGSNDGASGRAGAAPVFRETGGDDGRLTGVFTGQSHEGVVGTLERSDLTAAFGASR